MPQLGGVPTRPTLLPAPCPALPAPCAGDLNETFVVGEVDDASKQLVKVTYEVRWVRGLTAGSKVGRGGPSARAHSPCSMRNVYRLDTAGSAPCCTSNPAVPAQGDCDLQTGHALPRDWGGDHQARKGARVRRSRQPGPGKAC